MFFMDKIYKKAKELNKKIVLPETNDIRILKATEDIINKGYAQVILIGKEENIKEIAQKESIDLKNATILDPEKYNETEAYIEKYYEKRKHKGIDKDKAKEIITKDYLFFGAMMVEFNHADGMVAGADRPTADTLRALLHCVGTAEGIDTISSFFAMVIPDKNFGKDGILFFADCAVNPNPSPTQLRDIAIATADNYKIFMEDEPKVALLSFSTKGSAKHRDVDKVIKALELIKESRPDLIVDGEMQFDAAVIPKIGEKKAPGSQVAGKATVLIFPDLDAANIGYKIAQRIGKAEAIGPVIQGSRKPINDLSRGCSVEDIVNVTAITSVQAS